MTRDSATDSAPTERGLARWVKTVEDGALIVFLGGMIALAATQIVLRNLFGTAIIWADPALRVGVLWLGLLGAVAASREGRHITVDALSRTLPKRWRSWAAGATDLFTAAVSAFLAWHAGRLVLEDRASGMEAFSSVPVWVCELILPIAFSFIAVRHVLALIRRIRRQENPT